MPVLLERYLIREILKPLTGIVGVLTTIFAGYAGARLFAEAVEGTLTARTAALLIGLRLLVALEVLLPVALFFSVVATLERLHAEGEIVALRAAGVSEGCLLRSVLFLSLLVAAATAALSLYGRPWAYAESYRLRAEAAAAVEIARLEPGRFHQFGERRMVVYLKDIDRRSGRAEGVFVERWHAGERQITVARQALQTVDARTGERLLILRDGWHYLLGGAADEDKILHFQQYALTLRPQEITPEYRRKAAPWPRLVGSSDPADIAEWQWRLSTGPSAVLLGLLGVPLSRGGPRRRRHTGLWIAVLVFALYFNLAAIARTWVEKGAVPPFPGIWWLDALLLALLFLLSLRLRGRLRR